MEYLTKKETLFVVVVVFFLEGWNSSVDQKARRNDDVSSTPGCSRGPFSQSQFSVQTLLYFSYSPVNNETYQHL